MDTTLSSGVNQALSPELYTAIFTIYREHQVILGNLTNRFPHHIETILNLQWITNPNTGDSVPLVRIPQFDSPLNIQWHFYCDLFITNYMNNPFFISDDDPPWRISQQTACFPDYRLEPFPIIFHYNGYDDSDEENDENDFPRMIIEN